MSISIALYKGKQKLFNKLVSWWTRGPYSHCEIVYKSCEADGFDNMYNCYSSSFSDHGVRCKVMPLDPSNWDILELPEEYTKEMVYEFYKSNLNVKYDVLGLVGFVIGSISDNKNKMFCSEYCSNFLGYKEAWRINPNILATILNKRRT